MRIKINHNNNQLYCLYSKEQIEIGEKYIELIEDCLGEKILKTYSYNYLDILIDEFLVNYEEEPEIIEDHD